MSKYRQCQTTATDIGRIIHVDVEERAEEIMEFVRAEYDNGYEAGLSEGLNQRRENEVALPTKEGLRVLIGSGTWDLDGIPAEVCRVNRHVEIRMVNGQVIQVGPATIS